MSAPWSTRDAKGNERFAAADRSRSFTAGSLSSGAVFTLTPIWSLAATLGYTERAPTFYELYANGAHVATGTYEVGNANLSKGKSRIQRLALRFDNGTHNGSIGVFYSHFSNYIGLLGTGRTLNDEGEPDADGIPEYTYSGVRRASLALKPRIMEARRKRLRQICPGIVRRLHPRHQPRHRRSLAADCPAAPEQRLAVGNGTAGKRGLTSNMPAIRAVCRPTNRALRLHHPGRQWPVITSMWAAASGWRLSKATT